MRRALLGLAAIFALCVPAIAQTPPVTPPLARTTQGDFAGLLYASNFGQWQVPQGNLGTYSWNSPSYCYASTVGVTFLAFQVGTPITIVDTGNPSATEIVTPTAVTITQPTPGNTGSCAITIAPVNPHTTYYYTSATAGLQEALNWAGTTAYQVLLTPDWALLGGTTGMITAAHGTTPVTVLDERTSTYTPYVWNGSAYVLTGLFSTGCLGGNTIANGCTGATTAAGALANLNGISSVLTTAQTIASALDGSVINLTSPGALTYPSITLTCTGGACPSPDGINISDYAITFPDGSSQSTAAVNRGTVSSGSGYKLPAYGSSASTTVGPSNIATDSTGNNLQAPGNLAAGGACPSGTPSGSVCGNGAILSASALVIDSVNGSDSNPCTMAKPCQTITRLLALDTAAPNNHWCFVPGSSFATPLAVSTRTDLLIDTCGLTNGSQPFFDFSTQVSSGAWTATVGGGYQITGTIDTTTHGNAAVNLFENGQYLLRATSLSNMQATPGTYWVSSDTVANPTIYLNSTLGNPATSGATYYYSAHVGLDMTACTNCTINNISLRRGLDDIGEIGLGYYDHGTNLTTGQGGRHNLYMFGGSLVDYSTATDEYYSAGSGGAIDFVCYDDIASPQSCTFDHDTATQTAGAASIYNSNTGFYSHAGIGTRPNLTVSNSSALNMAIGIGAANVTNLIASNDTVTLGTISSAQGIGVASTATITGANISGSGASQLGVSIPNSTGAETITIAGPTGATDFLSGLNCNLSGTGGSCIYAFASSAGSTISYSNATLKSAAASVNLAGGNYTLAANYVSALSTTGDVLYAGGTGNTYTGNHNLYPPTISGWNFNGTPYGTLALWQATSGSPDAASSSYNPAYLQPFQGGIGLNGSAFSGVMQWVAGVASASYTFANASTSGGGSVPGYSFTGTPATGSGSKPTVNIGTVMSSYNNNGTALSVGLPSGSTGNVAVFGLNGTTVGTIDYLGDFIFSGNGTGTYLKTTSTSACSWYLYNSATQVGCIYVPSAGRFDFGSTNDASDGILGASGMVPGVLYSAAGTALPTCQAVTKGMTAVVSDATLVAVGGVYPIGSVYTSGGTVTWPVVCSYNTSTTTYAWYTH